MPEQKITDMPREQISDSTTFGFRPIPDPTVLTTAALLREISNLKELLQAEITHLQRDDKRIWDFLGNRGTIIREEIDALHVLLNERFHGVGLQFTERDKAITAALEAQKEAAAAQNTSNMEAAGKSEASFTKQIDQMQMIVNAIAKATDEKIDDLKTRMTLGEGTKRGMGESWGIIVAAGGLATGILIAVASYIR